MSKRRLGYLFAFLCLQSLPVTGELHAQPPSFLLGGEFDAARPSALINNTKRAGRPMLTVSPEIVPVGGAVTATWSGIARPSSTDWIGLYVPGTASTDFIDWIYVSCSKIPGRRQANGSCPFVVPFSVNAGRYELRLLANDSFNLLATSNAFTVLSWCEPVNLGATVNSAFNDQYPSITPNGLSLYFESNRPGGEGGLDLWVSQRKSVDSPWETPQNLGFLINSSADERTANFTLDGLTMYFSSARPGGHGALDFYVTRRTDPNDDFGWGPVQNLGEPINTAASEGGGVFQLDAAGDITHFYFIRDPALDEDFDIYVTVPDYWGGWETPVPVLELSSSGFTDTRPWVTRDGLEMFLSSIRPGGSGVRDLYVSTRASIGDAWGDPVNLGPAVNTSFREENGSLDLGDPSESTLYLFSNRPDGFGITDIYVTTRSCP